MAGKRNIIRKPNTSKSRQTKSNHQKSTSNDKHILSKTSLRNNRIISISGVITILVIFIAILWKSVETQKLFQNFQSVFQSTSNSNSNSSSNINSSSISISSSSSNVLSSKHQNKNNNHQEEKIEKFLNWLKLNGARISPSVTLAVFPEFGGFGLLAKNIDNKKENENEQDTILGAHTNDGDNSSLYSVKYLDEMFTIPDSIITSSKTFLERFNNGKIRNFQSRINQILSEHLPSNTMVQQDALIALHLMLECSLGDESTFKPYLDILPQTIIPRLDTFHDNELNMIQDEDLASLGRESNTQLRKFWYDDKLQTLLSSMMDIVTPQNAIDTTCRSFALFHRYVSIVSSRAMVLHGSKYLTPLAGMANYAPRKDDRKYFRGKMSQTFTLYHERSEADGSITVRADRNVMPGDQIFEDYGDIDNSLYLEAHGFVPNENPFHCAMIPTRFVPSPQQMPNLLLNAMISLKLLPGDERYMYTPNICILEDGSLSDSRAEAYLTVAALANSDNDDLVSKCAEALESNDNEFVELQCLYYVGSQNFLKHSIQKMSLQTICESKSSLEQDESLLNILISQQESKKSSNKNIDDITKKSLAVKFRISDKRILNKVAAAAAATDSQGGTNCSKIDELSVTISPCPIIKNDVTISSKNIEESLLLKQFNKFIDSLDMPVRKIQAALVGEGMRLGVVAKEDINEGEAYLSINASSVINVDTAISRNVDMNAILNQMKLLPESKKDGGFDILVLYIMYEKFVLQDESKWHPYLDLLPSLTETKNSSPLFFENIIYDYAAGSDLRIKLIRNKMKAEDSFLSLSRNKVIMKFFGLDVMHRDNFFWAYTIINSRSIWWNGQRHLVPLLDLVNCMELKNNAGSVAIPHQTLLYDGHKYAITKASTSFREGDQIFENYGQPNDIYFLYHGFILENNTHDFDRWNINELDGKNNMELRQIKKSLTERMQKYSATKRSLSCNDLDLPFRVPIMNIIQIAETEQIFFERALAHVTSRISKDDEV